MDQRETRTLNPESTGAGLMRALDAQYAADICKALATIDVYMANPVGIGEHPQHLDEVDKLLESIATAQDKRAALKQYYSYHITVVE